MITTTQLTLEEYLNRTDETEKHYELVAGNLSQMPPESPQNAEIAIKLLLIFFCPIYHHFSLAAVQRYRDRG